MKHKWTVIFGSVAAFIAAGQPAGAESKQIGCSKIPYVRHGLDTQATIPRCSVEHVSDPSKTYSVYRDVTMYGPSKAVIIVLYKASRGRFATDSGADQTNLRRQPEGTSPDDAGLAWAFEGFLKRPPEKIEAGPGPRHYRFEAPVAVFGGAVATCWAGFKDSSLVLDDASRKDKTSAVYAVALTCVSRDNADPLPDDSAYKPIQSITFK